MPPEAGVDLLEQLFDDVADLASRWVDVGPWLEEVHARRPLLAGPDGARDPGQL